MTCADKLRDLYAFIGLAVGDARRMALEQAIDALPEIAAVIEAAEKMREAEEAGMGSWTLSGEGAVRAYCKASDECAAALAALARRLETQP